MEEISSFWYVTCSLPFNKVEEFAHSLEPYPQSIGWFEGKTPHTWSIEMTFNQKPDVLFLQNVVDAIAKQHKMPPPSLHLEKRSNEDWLRETWKNFPPLRVGRFYIYGSHVEEQIPENLIGIELNAATAFGSGEHETTKGCLKDLCYLYDQGVLFTNPLDMGCGSGILAIATAKLWNISVMAVDHDLEAIHVTKKNALINECDTFINPLCYDGFDSPDLQRKSPFDLVIANILAGPLCLMAHKMVKNTASGGWIILSGLLTRQTDEVIRVYESAGALLKKDRQENGWTTLLLRKKSS